MGVTEKERIEVLMMIGFGDGTSSFREVRHLCNDTHPENLGTSRKSLFISICRSITSI